MEYRILGKTGLKASVVGIGGEGFENKSFPECEEIIDAAFSNGINIIDIYFQITHNYKRIYSSI